jgi:hypothetical protein
MGSVTGVRIFLRAVMARLTPSLPTNSVTRDIYFPAFTFSGETPTHLGPINRDILCLMACYLKTEGESNLRIFLNKN